MAYHIGVYKTLEDYHARRSEVFERDISRKKDAIRWAEDHLRHYPAVKIFNADWTTYKIMTQAGVSPLSAE